MSEYFTSSDKFIEAFKLDKRTDFNELTPFKNDIGFSIQRPYPKTSKFRPPVKSDGFQIRLLYFV